MTIELFREDGYLKTCAATVVSIVGGGDGGNGGGVCVDQTVFYPEGGGQPGDTGKLIRADGRELPVTDTRKDRETGAHLHIIAGGEALPEVGERVGLEIDWARRYRLMRMHSCMHMLCAAIPAPVTGGSISDGSGRLDFYLPEPPDKAQVEETLNRLIEADHPMSLRWISDEEMARQPELVRTMSVKPPAGSGQVRLVEFAGADLQPCGGTHVASSGEIGAVRVRSIKSKGRQNRRILIEFAGQ